MKWIWALLRLPMDLIVNTITYYPGPVGDKLRSMYWKRRLGHLGRHVILSEGVFFDHPRTIYIGDHTWLDRHVYIMSGVDQKPRKTTHRPNENFRFKTGEVHIGSHCHIAPNCVLNGMGGIQIGDKTGVATGSSIYSLSHHYRTQDTSDQSAYYFTPRVRDDQQAMVSGPVTIGDGCAIGLHCVILPGVDIGSGTWIGAGNIVVASVPTDHIVGVDGRRKKKGQ